MQFFHLAPATAGEVFILMACVYYDVCWHGNSSEKRL